MFTRPLPLPSVYGLHLSAADKLDYLTHLERGDEWKIGDKTKRRRWMRCYVATIFGLLRARGWPGSTPLQSSSSHLLQTRKDDATYICVVFCNFESAAWRVAQAASMFSQGEHAGFRKKQKMVFKVLKIGIVFRSVIIGGDLGGVLGRLHHPPACRNALLPPGLRGDGPQRMHHTGPVADAGGRRLHSEEETEVAAEEMEQQQKEE